MAADVQVGQTCGWRYRIGRIDDGRNLSQKMWIGSCHHDGASMRRDVSGCVFVDTKCCCRPSDNINSSVVREPKRVSVVDKAPRSH